MQQAGLTRGAFYSHFESKSQLYREAIRSIGTRNRQMLQQRQPTLQQMLQGYLSMAHRTGEDLKCSLAFMVTDVAHRDEEVRTAYTETFTRFVEQLSTRLPSDTSTSERISEDALRTAATMIGAVAVARAINDDSLAESLLSACERALINELEEC